MDPEHMKNLQLDKICRCCLTEKKEMRPLYGELIADMVSECFRISVERMDGWPDKICMQCVHQVCRFHSFKQRVEKCDQQLREYINGITIVVEKPIPPELSITKIAQPFIARAPMQIATTAAFARQPVQIQPSPTHQLVNGQLIPIQMLSGAPQVLQIRRAGDDTCELITLQTRNTGQLPQLTSDPQSVDTEQYFDEEISPHDGSLDIVDALDELEEGGELEGHKNEETVEEYGEDIEQEVGPDFEVEEIDHYMELEKSTEEHVQRQDEQCEEFRENLVEDWNPAPESVEEESPQFTAETEKSDSRAAFWKKIDQNIQQSVESIADSDDDADTRELMASFITSQTSCPEPGRHVCNLCQKEFRFSKWLHNHMKSHSNWIKANCKKRPECHLCHKKFQGPGMLRMHMKTHEVRLFKCEICLKPFQNEYHLNLHQEKHKTADSINCEICERKFISQNDLRIHKRMLGKSCAKYGAPEKKNETENLDKFLRMT